MTQLEYDQKKRECWTKVRFALRDPNSHTTAFNFIFDRAYALGEQETAAEGEEMLSVPKSIVQEMYAANTRLRKEFPNSEIGNYSAEIMRMLRELFGSKCLPGAEIFNEPTAKNPKETAKTFASDESTDTKSDDFDRIVKDGFRGHNRLHIAAMAMQGILSNFTLVKASIETYKVQVGDNDLYKCVAKAACDQADTLIAECELSPQSLCSAKKGGGDV